VIASAVNANKLKRGLRPLFNNIGSEILSGSDNNQSILDDVSASFKGLITERFTSPFLFSFVVAWIILNHKLLILGLSSTTDKFSIEQKFQLFNTVLNSSFIELPFSDKTLLLSGFLFPMVSAVFYTFIYPFADYFITKFTLERKVKLRNLRVQKEHEIYYTFEDVQKIYSRHAAEEANWKLRIDRAEISDVQKDTVIAGLQARLNELDSNKAMADKEKVMSGDVKSFLSDAKQAIEVGSYDTARELLETLIAGGSTSEKRQAKTLINRLNALQSEANNKEPNLTSHEREVVNSLAKAANTNQEFVEESTFLKATKGSSILEKKIAIDDLINKKIVIRGYSPDIGAETLELTVQGMKLFRALQKKS
jgi:FimV-like protein